MFNWQCHPEAENWLDSLLNGFKVQDPHLATLEEELSKKTSTRLFDWIDHFSIDSRTDPLRYGFEPVGSEGLFAHPGAKLPFVRADQESPGVAVKVESIADYLMTRGVQRKIEGSPFSPYRRAFFSKRLVLVERRGTFATQPIECQEIYPFQYITAQEKWLTRDRSDMEKIATLADELVRLVGRDAAAWIVLEGERKYWQVRNTAAQIQKNRQDSLGMGWANHDHHTFRSSRAGFTHLVNFFEKLGFHCRERFYAGVEAGWGAQIMENSVCGLVLFLDVDLAPEEIEIDFAHQPLPEKSSLGTVGLWCGLHGDSILEAGMHHLEAQFLFDDLKEDLGACGVAMMDPFSNFSYLRQAFTKGEMWPVKPERVESLLRKGFITSEQAEAFLREGAVGSHLENLQRKEGYKGFNKNNVSLIIKKTDPRLYKY